MDGTSTVQAGGFVVSPLRRCRETAKAAAARLGLEVRVDKLLARYAGKNVLVVSHVAPVRQLIRLALGAPPDALFRRENAAASVSVVAYDAYGTASVRSLNDMSHVR